jgi:hypothetical protein
MEGLRRKGGRNGNQPVYTPEIAKTICDRLAKGESLIRICRSPGMPAESTVRFWAAQNQHGFAEKYAFARNEQVKRWAEEIIDISDENFRLPDGSIDHGAVQAARLRVDTRKWLLSKLLPRQYGDKVELTGADGGPIQHCLDVPAKETREQWLARQAAIDPPVRSPSDVVH